ncbi:MAG: hypothetical protein E7591_00765 [Ruminococcaceae bacterium]|nr:hypothetical protein [Oscillospiraceae bacterium]
MNILFYLIAFAMLMIPVAIISIIWKIIKKRFPVRFIIAATIFVLYAVIITVLRTDFGIMLGAIPAFIYYGSMFFFIDLFCKLFTGTHFFSKTPPLVTNRTNEINEKNKKSLSALESKASEKGMSVNEYICSVVPERCIKTCKKNHDLGEKLVIELYESKKIDVDVYNYMMKHYCKK